MAVLAQPFPRRTTLNGAAIFAGEALARLATFALAILVARQFGPAALGQYGYAVALANVLLIIPDLGLHLFATRELAVEPRRLRVIFWSIHWLKLLLVGVVVIVAAGLGEWAVRDEGRRLLFYILVVRVLFQTFSQAYMAVFKAFERMQYVAIQQFVNACLVVAWATGVLALDGRLDVLVCGLLAGQAAEMWVGWRFVQKAFSPGRPCKWDGQLLKGMLAAGIPIGVTAILQTLNLRLDILVLGLFVSSRELGHFQAAAWFMVGTFLLASLLMAVLFPKLSRLLRGPDATGSAYVEKLLKAGVLLMSFASVIVWLAAPHLLRGLFGVELANAANALRVLAAALPLMFLNTVRFYVFVAARSRGVYLAALTLGVGAGALLSFGLSSRFGVTGAAWADLGREFIVCVLYLSFLAKTEYGRRVGRALRRVVVGAAALVGLMFLVGPSPLASAWAALWNLLLLAGALLSLGRLQLDEAFFLADDRL